MKIAFKFHKLLNSMSTISFIVVMELLLFVPSIFLGIILDLIGFSVNTEGPESIKSLSLISLVISTSIIAPLVETFIFQFGIIRVLQKIQFTKNKQLLIILISAGAFGLTHYYSWEYIFNTFLIGILLSYSFLVYDKKNKNPFLVVCILHSVRNFISTILTSFL